LDASDNCVIWIEIVNVVAEFIDAQFKCHLSYESIISIYRLLDPLFNTVSHKLRNVVDQTELRLLISSY